jgi:two-component system, NtrC family, nitrogen regulation sensor histidine kinase GlnL
MRSGSKPEQGQSGLSFATVLQDCLASGIVIVSAAKKITAFNPGAERVIGRKASQTLGRSLAVLPEPLRQLVRATLASGEPTPEVEINLPSRGPDKTAARVVVIPLKTGRKRSGVAVVLNDITPVKRLEQNLRGLDRLASIGMLSASTAHEIKNALVAVKTFVDLLLEKNRDDELARTVGREMRRIDAIVSQMLRFGGPARPAHSAVRVHDVLDHALRMVQHQIDGKLISLNRRFNASPDTVKGDDYQLEQAFVNLLLNALEAMGPNGTLAVVTESVPTDPQAEPRAAHRIRVSVQDTGVGIAPENMARLFEPFFTTKQNGTGLGLSICQRIIQEHHGVISVQSEPNKGTAFTVFLPSSGPAPCDLPARANVSEPAQRGNAATNPPRAAR